MPRKPRFVATPSPILPMPNPAPVAPSHTVPPRVHVLSSTPVASTDASNTAKPSTPVASTDASNATTQNSSVSLPPQSFNGYWDIKLIDENGNIMEAKKKVKDVWSLKRGVKVVLDINDVGQPIDKSGGLFGFFLGDLGADFSTFPIGYRSWKQIPKSTKKDVFNSIIKQNCKTNMNCQSKQIPHTGGSLSLARRKHELEKGGEIVSRGTLWTLTHKRKHDGQYVNLEAEKIAQKIISIEEQDENARILSPQDSLGQVFGSEHNGRVRGIGFGPVPTQVFGQTSYMGSSSSTQIKITRLESELKVERQKVQTLQASQKVMGNVLVSFLRSQGKEVPLELTSLIVSTESDVENAGQESENSFAEQNEEQE
ncbi:hypothetical protein ACFE04_020483 [Oxalis oulophora]